MSLVERTYRLTAILSAVVGVGSIVGGLLALLGLVRPNENGTPRVLFATIAIVAGFLVVNIILRLIAARSTAFPVPSELHRKATLAALAVFVVVMGYGVLRWPAAPVRATAQGYLDKTGRVYSYESFLAFKRWEAAFILFFLPVMLGGLADIPTKGVGAVQQRDEADEARAG